MAELDTKETVETVGQASRLSENYWQRHLPHFQLSGGYFFITFSCYKRQKLLPSQKDIVYQAIHFLNSKRYELLAVVIMDDHVHMIIEIKDTLSKIMHSIKSYTAHQINKAANKVGRVWQDESFDHVIRNEGEFLQKLKYIANNPVKAELAERYENYKWLYVKGWINEYSQTEGTPALRKG